MLKKRKKVEGSFKIFCFVIVCENLKVQPMFWLQSWWHVIEGQNSVEWRALRDSLKFHCHQVLGENSLDFLAPSSFFVFCWKPQNATNSQDPLLCSEVYLLVLSYNFTDIRPQTSAVRRDEKEGSRCWRVRSTRCWNVTVYFPLDDRLSENYPNTRVKRSICGTPNNTPFRFNDSGCFNQK